RQNRRSRSRRRNLRRSPVPRKWSRSASIAMCWISSRKTDPAGKNGSTLRCAKPPASDPVNRTANAPKEYAARDRRRRSYRGRRNLLPFLSQHSVKIQQSRRVDEDGRAGFRRRFGHRTDDGDLRFGRQKELTTPPNTRARRLNATNSSPY